MTKKELLEIRSYSSSFKKALDVMMNDKTYITMSSDDIKDIIDSCIASNDIIIMLADELMEHKIKRKEEI